MVATIFSRFKIQKPETSWDILVSRVNNLAFFARQEAITQRKVFRLTCEVGKQPPDFLYVEREETDPDKPEKKLFKPYSSGYFKSRLELPSQIRIKAVYQNGKEQLEQNKGKNAYCHIVPDGITEDILIHLVKNERDVEELATIKMRPFLGNFEFFDNFIK